MSILNSVCVKLGVPVAEHKRDGPTTCLIFLGIEIDTTADELRLLSEKLLCLQTRLAEWGDRKSCRRRELESLIALLNHASKVVRSARSFLCRMLDLLHGVHSHRHHSHLIRLNTEFRADLAWWRIFVKKWNGISFLSPPSQLPALHVVSDASGSWGCGAWHQSAWFQLGWAPNTQQLDIVVKELIPIILASCTYFGFWYL